MPSQVGTNVPDRFPDPNQLEEKRPKSVLANILYGILPKEDGIWIILN
jgi:hypothetical protein